MEPTDRKLKRYQHLANDPLVSKWLAGLKKWTVYGYQRELNNFLTFVEKTPEQIIAERRADMKLDDEEAKHRYEKLVMEFCIRKRAEKPASAQKAMAAIRSFFDYHYAPLKFRRTERQQLGKITPTYIDYLPTREDTRAMVEAADVRDRAIILTLASTGISGDVCELTRAQFEQGLARRKAPNDPVCLAPRGDYLRRTKTGVRMRPFLTCDAVQAIKIYLRNRKDDSPWLFTERGGKKMTSDAVNKVVQRLAEKALEIPPGQRMRMHNFRDFFEEACRANDVAENWIYVMDGRKIAGSSDFYTHATEDKLIEKFKKVEPHLSASRLSNFVLLRRQHEVALDDQARTMFEVMRLALGDERFKQGARFYAAMQPMIKWDPDKEYEPAIYRTQRILREMLGEETADRKRKRPA